MHCYANIIIKLSGNHWKEKVIQLSEAHEVRCQRQLPYLLRVIAEHEHLPSHLIVTQKLCVSCGLVSIGILWWHRVG